MVPDPQFDPEFRMMENARERRRSLKLEQKERLRKKMAKARRAVVKNFMECIRCGNPGRGKTFGVRGNKVRVCANCWGGMSRTEKENVASSF